MFVGPPFHAMPFVRHVDYGASSIFINLTDTRKWFGKERAQHHLNPRTQEKHKGKDGARAPAVPLKPLSFPHGRGSMKASMMHAQQQQHQQSPDDPVHNPVRPTHKHGRFL